MPRYCPQFFQRFFYSLLFLLAFINQLRSAESDITPTNQPLLVIRATNPELVEGLFDTRQMHALGLNDWDNDGKIAGLPVEIGSYRFFMKSLAASQAKDFWYCLFQSGGTLISRSAGLGFSWHQEKNNLTHDDFARWLNENAFPTEEIVLSSTCETGSRHYLTIASDQTAMHFLYAGKNSSYAYDNGWRESLRAFLANETDVIGAWTNPRPVAGLASLLIGVDLPAMTEQFGLRFPNVASLEIFRTGDDLGFSASFDNILPQLFPNTGNTVVRNNTPALASIGFSSPFHHADAMNRLRNILSVINLDVRAFIPQAGCFNWWRDETGENRWSFAALIPCSDSLSRQEKRLFAALETLTSSPSFPFSMERITINGDKALCLKSGGVTAFCTTGFQDDRLFLLVGGTIEDIPTLDTIRVETTQTPHLLWWRTDLDEDTVALLSDILLKEVSEWKVQMDRDSFKRLLQPAEEASLSLKAGGVTIRSLRSVSAALIPALTILVQEKFEAYQHDPLHMTAARLRWLWNTVNRWRFRQTRSGQHTDASLPRELAMLVPAAAKDQRWLDELLPVFPGSADPNSHTIGKLAQEAVMAGFAYGISANEGEWFLYSRNLENGDELRLNENGLMERLTDNGWVAYPMTPIDVFMDCFW